MSKRLGRLFWKFFFFFWLAQFLTSLGVGVIFWLSHDEHGHEPHHAPPPRWEEGRPPPRPEPGPPPRSIFPPWQPLAAGSAISVLFAALLAWYFSRPIRSLHRAFSAVADGALDTRVSASMGDRRDELSDLGVAFDRMAEQLQGLVEGQRRLLHDVSHELRSPLARVQAAVDLLRQQPERGKELVDRIERDATRMDVLVGELLALVRIETGNAGRLDERVDLNELLAGLSEDLHFEANLKGCPVEFYLHDGLVVRGNAQLLHRAIENVVRNALRYSPSGGWLIVSGAKTQESVSIEVCDEGPGVREDELALIFEPFFRGSGTDAFSGHGLGLAIVRRIVDAHGGRIAAANRPTGGFCVTLSFPLAGS